MPQDFTYLDLAGDWESLMGARVMGNNNKHSNCERYIVGPLDACSLSDPPSAATFTFFQPALSDPSDSDSSDPMDSMPVSFPSLLTMDFTATPRPASPTDSLTDSSSSDSDYSPPQTPVDLESNPFLDQDEIADFGEKLPPSLLETRDIRLDTCTAPPDDELFVPEPAFAIPAGLNAASAAWLALLCRREAYLYPSRVADTTVCVYDPSWHEDSLRGYPLPRVTVTGCAEDAEQWFENAAEDDEGPCWDHLMAPMITNTGRMSQCDEEFFYPYPIQDQETLCCSVFEDDDEEPAIPECISYEARWRGASLQELEDELAKQKVLVEMQRVGEDGFHTYVPERVEGRRWLWKNF